MQDAAVDSGDETVPSTADSNVPTEQGATQSRGDDNAARRRVRIAMISDFFFPNVGGVEGHIHAVSQQLLKRGHKVIVVTHAYPPHRTGIRWLAGGLKVYYVPYAVLARQDTLPNFFSLLPLLRQIFLRERIELVHAHQALSSMAHEGILHARSMGIRAVFTDHSLFGFADAASILTNKLLKFVLSDVEHVVCVSHTGKENTVLRAALDPHKVSVIPNAVVASDFRPDPSAPQSGRSGDGPKRVDLEQMREKYLLNDRVDLVGAIRPSDARAHLTRGHLFLNTSLTEAFGTGIIEAASAGLFVVSTRVGGVPEVLPAEFIELAEPDEDDVVRAVNRALAHLRSGAHSAQAAHEAVAHFYSWSDVAARLERVYLRAMDQELVGRWERLGAYRACGPVAGLVFVIVVVVEMLFLELLQVLWPVRDIDTVPEILSLDGSPRNHKSRN
ncbi:Phosphatidylinositol N-acetylglucosaminyltransferase GPI3 subunit [Tilletia horrida]|uniref:Phosphatidylinositol N-acetylglucosaminyltransferase GPI3 subunit n=1 Tax=Tilletia horrida TaxID=155126 RepID=A0AAN6G7S2_9BASI|nr:Phosphatidylinositol N-acetylglucosaminyltransferase GPI3 subunit [Tilletia horrida]